MEQAIITIIIIIIIIIIFVRNLISHYEKQIIPTRIFCSPYF